MMELTKDDKLAADKKKGGLPCPECNKKNKFSAVRIKRTEEYKHIETDQAKLRKKGHKYKNGVYPYRGGAWILDNTDVGDLIRLRCSACDTTIGRKDLDGYADYELDSRKGLKVISSSVAKMFFGGDDNLIQSNNETKSSLRKHGVGIDDGTNTEHQAERVNEIHGLLDELGLDDVDIETIKTYIGNKK
tara:strand:- start:85 stop:651 length:567 start_codon:yes stop_codon:yes gene_type:complete